MKCKLISIFAGLFIFLACFTTSIITRDYFYKRELSNEIHKIKVGMSEQEVIEILGEPNDKFRSDVPGLFWSYETDSISQLLNDNPDRIGRVLLQTNENGKVIKVYNH
jgi:hypothetical protein